MVSSAPSASSQALPIQQSISSFQRIASIDVVWGVTVLGILLTTILPFGMTEASYYQVLRGPHGLSYWLLTIVHVLFEHKMQALFSMLFGAGILLFLAKKRDGNTMASPELFIRGQLWLIVFGLVNALILLWPFDILFHYGVVGILLFPLGRLPARWLLVGAIVAGLIYSGKNYWEFTEQRQKYAKYQTVTALQKKTKKLKLTDEQKEDKSAWEGLVKSKSYDPKADKAEVAAMRSDYAAVWSHVLPKTQQAESVTFYQFTLWDIVSMMLFGMALCKWGFFTNQLSTPQYSLLAIAGLAVGQLMAWAVLPNTREEYVNFTQYVSAHTLPVAKMVLPFEWALTAIGWASLVLLLYRANVLAGFWKAVGAVGQMAFTNYVLQSMVCTLFFYGYGFGYFGELKIYQLYVVVAEIWLIQLVFSVVWLHYFRFGPVEWLWRSLAYGNRQPMMRLDSKPAALA